MKAIKIITALLIGAVVLGVFDTYLLKPTVITSPFALSLCMKVIYGAYGAVIYGLVKKLD